jgi:hypothetical protein
MLSNGRSRRSNKKVKNIKGARFSRINTKTHTNAHKMRTAYLNRKSGGNNKTLKQNKQKPKTKNPKTQNQKTKKSKLAKLKLSTQTRPTPDNFSDYNYDGHNRKDSPDNFSDYDYDSSNDGYNRMDLPNNEFDIVNSSNDGYNRMDSPNNGLHIVNSGGKNKKHKRKNR